MIPVEMPPAAYATGPLPSDLNILREPTPELADRICRALNGPPEARIYLACYIPQTHTIVLPSGLSATDETRVLFHEQAHARGWRHPKPYSVMGHYR